MSNVTHRLVGYDRSTEAVAVEYEIPERFLDFAKGVAGVGSDDPDAVMCYQLSPSEARDLAGTIDAPIDTDRLDFFMEGFA